MSHFLNAITQHYADFGGRARRKEYWCFVLFSVLASWVCQFADVVFNLYTTAGDPATGRIGVATTIYSLLVVLPSLSIMVRRLHDTGRSGWFALAPYLPIAMIFIGVAATIAGGFNSQTWPVERILGGMQVFLVLVFAWVAVSIYVLVLLCMGSEPGANAYGPNPVTVDQTDALVASPQRVDSKVCPRCAETVKAAAQVCRFCGCEFDERTVGVPAFERNPSEANAGVADAEGSRIGSQHRVAEVAIEIASSAPPRAIRADAVPPLLFGQKASEALEASPIRQRYAYALLIPLVAFMAAQTALGVLERADIPPWLYLAFLVINVALVTADSRRNNGFITPLGFFVAATIVPIWLWTRGSVFKTTRSPFWCYLAVIGLFMFAESLPMPAIDSTTSSGVSTPATIPMPVSALQQPIAESGKGETGEEQAITFTGPLSCTSEACQLNGFTFTQNSVVGRAVLASCKQDDLCRVTGIVSNRTESGGTLSSVSTVSRGAAGVDDPQSSVTLADGPAVFHVGDGVEKPTRIREVKPQYTEEAMQAKIQGTVALDAVIGPDGTVTEVRVTRSLDTVYGLDEQARKAAFATPFFPCKRQGQPVACVVSLEMQFTLR